MRFTAILAVFALVIPLTVCAERPSDLARRDREAPPPEVRDAAMRAVTAPVQRAQVIESLLASPKGRGMLSNVLAGSGVAAETLRTKTIDGRKVHRRTALTVSQGPSPAEPPDLPAYEDIDWHAGVTISPAGAPRFAEGNRSHPVGTIDMFGVDLCEAFLTLSQAAEQGVVPDIDQADVVADLPAEPGTYLIRVHLRPYAGWVDGWEDVSAQLRDKVIIQEMLWFGNSTWIPLADGSGVVCTCSVDPGEGVARHSLRRANFWLSITENDFPFNLMFGGVTIMRL